LGTTVLSSVVDDAVRNGNRKRGGEKRKRQKRKRGPKSGQGGGEGKDREKEGWEKKGITTRINQKKGMRKNWKMGW